MLRVLALSQTDALLGEARPSQDGLYDQDATAHLWSDAATGSRLRFDAAHSLSGTISDSPLAAMFRFLRPERVPQIPFLSVLRSIPKDWFSVGMDPYASGL